MKSTKIMLLGLFIVLFDVSIGLVPLPEPCASWILHFAPRIQTGPHGYEIQAAPFLSGVAYTIILIGIIVGLIGVFRKNEEMHTKLTHGAAMTRELAAALREIVIGPRKKRDILCMLARLVNPG